MYVICMACGCMCMYIVLICYNHIHALLQNVILMPLSHQIQRDVYIAAIYVLQTLAVATDYLQFLCNNNRS